MIKINRVINHRPELITESTESSIIQNIDSGRNNSDTFFDDTASLSGQSPWRTTQTGHTVKLKLTTRDLIHPFKGINKGSRLFIQVSTDQFGIFYEGECLLSTWHDDPTNGETITLKLDIIGGNNPFQVIELQDVLHLKVWLLANDESFVPVKKKFSSLSPVKQANIMCKLHDDFKNFCFVSREFLENSGEYLPLQNPEISERFATETVRAFCNIGSRAKLGEDSTEGMIARRKWSTLLDHFNTWRG